MELQDRLEELESSGIGIAAISYDSQEVLAAFAERRGITFPLLSDDGSSVITEFGILNTVVIEGLGPNQDDPEVVADIHKYVAASVFDSEQLRRTIVGTPFPGTFYRHGVENTELCNHLGVFIRQQRVCEAPLLGEVGQYFL